MSNAPSNNNHSAPFACKYQDNYILFCNGIVKSLVQSAIIGILFVVAFSCLFNFYWFPDDYSVPFSYRIFILIITILGGFLISYLLFKNIFAWEKCILDEKGFHYLRYNWFDAKNSDDYIVSDNFKEIPLSDISRFRLQRDELGYYVEIVENEETFKCCRTYKINQNQEWFVAAGNLVLSNLTGEDIRNISIPEESIDSLSESEISQSDFHSNPFGCSFRNYHLTFKNNCFLRRLKYLLIAAIAVFLISAIFPLSSDIQFILYISLILAALICIIDRTEEKIVLDEKGLHLSETTYGGCIIMHNTTDFPLDSIVKFRLQNDEKYTFVEILTKTRPVCICRHFSFNNNGSKTQRWLVTAGNIVLSNILNVDCRSLKVEEDSCDFTLIRLYPDQIINDVQPVESDNVTVQTEADRIDVSVRKENPMDIFTTSLILLIYFGLAIFGGFVYFYYKAQRIKDGTPFHPFEFVALPAIILFFLGVNYFLDNLPKIASQQWTFTSNSAIRRRSLFNIALPSRTFDFSNYSYMEIRVDISKNVVMYKLVFFNDNDRFICEINNLEIDEAAWIANEIQQIR